MAPLVRLLKLDGETDLPAELARTRAVMAEPALARIEAESAPAAIYWRSALRTRLSADKLSVSDIPLDTWRAFGLTAVRSQREQLEELRNADRVGPDAFLILQEELDFNEVAIGSDQERHIEES